MFIVLVHHAAGSGQHPTINGTEACMSGTRPTGNRRDNSAGRGGTTSDRKFYIYITYFSYKDTPLSSLHILARPAG
jgi:hypothetical protein